MRRAGGVLQTPGRRRKTEEESAQVVGGLVPGYMLRADDGYAAGRGGVTESGARVGGL